MLTPASTVYQKIQQTLYKTASPYRSALPVICIGNIQLGGSGKTPVTQSLCQMIYEHNIAINPVILLRGYGGSLKGPSLVAAGHHTTADVGDEALLHAQYNPTIIARDRAAGARLAEAGGHDLILMDDGLQNNQLEKTLSFLVFNTEQGLGNELVFPAGPLREAPQTALEKIDAVFRIGDSLPFETDKPVFDCHIAAAAASDPNQSYIAFCGIGHPEKFQKTLHQTYHHVIDFIPYADHHVYSEKNLQDLEQKALTHNARLITTEKDWMRLPPDWQHKTDMLKITYLFDQKSRLVDFIKQALAR